jgi:ATP-dependent DNA helicase RecQ
VENVDATREAQIVLSAIGRTGERFGIHHIIDVVVGADTERIRQLGHHTIKTYGVGRDRDRKYWRFIVDNLLGQELLVQTDDQYPVLKLAEAARGVLFEGDRVLVMRQKETARHKRRATAEPAMGDGDLFQVLRALRKRLADEQHVPPYVVFSDRTLHEMTAAFPCTDAEMSHINGVGETKLARYGAVFAQAVREFLAAHPDIVKPPSPELDLREPAVAERSAMRAEERHSTFDVTWELVQAGQSVDEIAARRGLTSTTICGHLERLITMGRDVDIDRFVPTQRRLLIEELLSRVRSDKLADVMQAAEVPLTYDEVRLVRAWCGRDHSRETEDPPEETG